jgi:hypothetical protein
MKRSDERTVAGQKVRALLLPLLCGGLLATGLAGCRRKAPGPDECVAFAKVWVQRRPRLTEQGLAVADPFDELVRDCLTIPYDRALVECVINGKAPERCRTEYRRRVEEEREQR